MNLSDTDIFPFQSALGAHVLLVDGSRIYDVHADLYRRLDGNDGRRELADLLPAERPRFVDDTPLTPPAVRALSLNVAQQCNLACGYCYADEGRFGKQRQQMSIELALDAVDLLLAETGPGQDAVLGFMGGEPFLNRELLRTVVRESAQRATEQAVNLRYAITTNATLITEADAQILRDYRFTVTVSLDGDRALNDKQRPAAGGRSSYDKALEGLSLLSRIRPYHLSIRSTVTPQMRDLPSTLDHLMSFGVDEVGFSPVLTGPLPEFRLDEGTLNDFLLGMIACGERTKMAILGGRRYPFSNFETAMQEIARGTHRPYPCGAAASYASVGADGGIYACHRAIGDETFAIGTVDKGFDRASRQRFLTERHLSRQTPCTTCWARQLCGGGCHQEVAQRGRVSCDYIRGWLAWCLQAYVELSEHAPTYFTDPGSHFSKSAR